MRELVAQTMLDDRVRMAREIFEKYAMHLMRSYEPNVVPGVTPLPPLTYAFVIDQLARAIMGGEYESWLASLPAWNVGVLPW